MEALSKTWVLIKAQNITEAGNGCLCSSVSLFAGAERGVTPAALTGNHKISRRTYRTKLGTVTGHSKGKWGSKERTKICQVEQCFRMLKGRFNTDDLKVYFHSL